MTNASLVKPASIQTYASLRAAVRKAIALGKERAVRAVGKLILEHILLKKDRVEYGEAVIGRLGQDIGVSDRKLRYMVEFARTYPIRPPAANLSWAHYRDLLGIHAGDERQALVHLAAENDWIREQLRTEIKKNKAGAAVKIINRCMLLRGIRLWAAPH
ncbi:MAG: DUF1016 N-terminal domain-containing protein [Candidatus Omnitrophota bacterium]|nr:DUF1016 N-terminal domain-containing protein [Candidatus Omnitrophota bacterium]